jgi:hypothetical protein
MTVDAMSCIAQKRSGKEEGNSINGYIRDRTIRRPNVGNKGDEGNNNRGME